MTSACSTDTHVCAYKKRRNESNNRLFIKWTNYDRYIRWHFTPVWRCDTYLWKPSASFWEMYFTRENNGIFSGSHRIIRIIDLIWKVCESVVCWSTGTGSSLFMYSSRPSTHVTYQLKWMPPPFVQHRRHPKWISANRTRCYGWARIKCGTCVSNRCVHAFVTD